MSDNIKTKIPNNIMEADLYAIIEKFCPLYESMDGANKQIVKDAYKQFFEENLSYSFSLKTQNKKD